MKRVAFAWVTKIIDFETYQEACDYVINGLKNKPWNFKEQNDTGIYSMPFSFEENYQERLNQYAGRYIYHTSADSSTYCFGNKEVTEYWSVEVNIPYGKYNSGW